MKFLCVGDAGCTATGLAGSFKFYLFYVTRVIDGVISWHNLYKVSFELKQKLFLLI